MKSGPKVVATWSGGLDTTVLVALLCETYGCEVYPIFVHRGQLNCAQELAAVRYFTDLYLVRYSNKFHRPFEVSVSIPAHEFKDAFPEARIGDLYALRNSDLANQAVRYAKLINSRIVAVGSTQDDAFGDDKPSFWEAKNYEIKTGTEDRNLEILAPFQQLGWKKSDITLWGVKRKLPLASTWSCWNNGEKHCGSCQACVSRKDAFRIAKCGGDPTQYAG